MYEFTNEEKQRITELYGNDFKDITPNDAQLIGRWEAFKALQHETAQAEINAIKERAENDLKQSREKHAILVETLNAQKEEALAKLKAVKNGIEK